MRRRRKSDEQIWKPIAGYEGLYEASTGGRIRSLDRTVVFAASCKQGSHTKRLVGRVIKPTLTKGYPCVSLYREHVREQRMVHAVVAETFLGPRPTGLLACHRNGIKTDCSKPNIYWGTPLDNSSDMVAHGTRLKGRDHPHAKLDEREIKQIRRMAGTKKQSEIAAKFGVSQSRVSVIINNKAWTHVPLLGVTA